MSLIIDGTSGVTFNDSSLQGAAASPYVLKNRIINGDMRIDQRNAGASVTPADSTYTLDRWQSRLSQASKYSVQQSSTAPTGFKNSLLVTSLSAYTVGASEFFQVRQIIEGYNVADLGFGTASAQTITISFWARSSLTGTFGGVLSNADGDRTYVFSYTINAANTWEQKSITIAGDTTGTWLTTNGGGFVVAWSLGAGSSVSTTAGVWNSSLFRGVTGGTSVVGTNGATFYITGVQLEIGTSATPFERRLYGQELINCQRYYYKWTNDNAGVVDFCIFQVYAGGSAFGKLFDFPVTMRATPTGTASGTFNPYNNAGSVQAAFTSTNVDSLTKQGAGVGAWTGSSGMTAGSATGIRASASAFIAVTAEL